MADTGAPWNIPYVEPTDIPRTYPDDSEDLALAIAAGLTAAGNAGIGSNVVSVTKTDTFSASVAQGAFVDITDLEVTITPSSNTSKILILANVHASSVSVGTFANNSIRLDRSGTSIAVGAASGSKTSVTSTLIVTSDFGANLGFTVATFLDSPGTASAVTYKVQLGNVVNASGTITLYVNRSSNFANFSFTPLPVSTLTVIEVAP